MRLLLTTLFAFLLSLGGQAQKQQDFVTRFMGMYGTSSALTSITVGPEMMGKILQLPEAKEDRENMKLMQELKTIQVVECGASTHEAADFYQKAVELAKANSARYKAMVDEDSQKVYTRKRKNTTVEVVLLSGDDDGFCAVSITGNISDTSLGNLIGK